MNGKRPVSNAEFLMDQAKTADRRRFHPESPIAEMQRLDALLEHLILFGFRKTAFRSDEPGRGVGF